MNKIEETELKSCTLKELKLKGNDCNFDYDGVMFTTKHSNEIKRLIKVKGAINLYLSETTGFKYHVKNIEDKFKTGIWKFLNENIELSKVSNFKTELQSLINKYSKENGSNTPDFILAEYLTSCLDNFDNIVNKRDKWNKD